MCSQWKDEVIQLFRELCDVHDHHATRDGPRDFVFESTSFFIMNEVDLIH